MAINQNHLFEELDGIKCAIVEKLATPQRVAFLKSLLEFNKYTVVVVPSPPPKAPPPPKIADPAATPPEPPPLLPETFTIGVTDVRFNPTNAIFGRLLRAPGGRVVTMEYWQQKSNESRDDVPYFENTGN
ncbi:hypothetical protein [Pollutibacter soli]|uniref:hypothetical protein n=1 Tax=Pollutibacter soli TaxID=3034157 RepID=UPI0030140909